MMMRGACRLQDSLGAAGVRREGMAGAGERAGSGCDKLGGVEVSAAGP